MPAKHEGADIAHRDAEFLGQEMPETTRVEHARHADDLLVRQAGKLAQRPDHCVQRIGDTDHERIGRVGGNALTDGFHDFQVDAKQVVAAHAGLARHTGGDDDHIGARYVGVIGGAFHIGIEPCGGAGLGDIQGLALGDAIRNVEQDDIAQFLECYQMGKRAADLSCADKGDLGSGHERRSPKLR